MSFPETFFKYGIRLPHIPYNRHGLYYFLFMYIIAMKKCDVKRFFLCNFMKYGRKMEAPYESPLRITKLFLSLQLPNFENGILTFLKCLQIKLDSISVNERCTRIIPMNLE